MTDTPKLNEAADGGLRTTALFGWIAISDQLPNVGDVIACAAEHHEGGMMFWAGTIIEIWSQGFAVIEEKGEKTRSYILTGDTLWMPLPSLPNAEVSRGRTIPTPEIE